MRNIKGDFFKISLLIPKARNTTIYLTNEILLVAEFQIIGAETGNMKNCFENELHKSHF